jgi:DNA replication protein DnaC
MSKRVGYSIYFVTLSELADQVPRDGANTRWAERLRVLSYPRLLIIDEVGYAPLDQRSPTLSSLWSAAGTKREP